MASLDVPNSDDLLARFIDSSEMETNVSENGAIISRKGTIRGVQDTVKNTVQNFKKMKVKPNASPMMRRVMEVSIKKSVLTKFENKFVAPCRRSARTKPTESEDKSSFT